MLRDEIEVGSNVCLTLEINSLCPISCNWLGCKKKYVVT